MFSQITASALLLASAASAAPSPAGLFARQEMTEPAAWNSTDFTTEIQLQGCNDTQSQLLRDGLGEMYTIAQHAIDRTLRFGADDPLYTKYFGSNPPMNVIGYYTQLVSGDKTGVVLRCDNPDGNCNEVTEEGPWAGHWRGENATMETVICEPTYNRRSHLDTLCTDGKMIGGEPAISSWLGTDLMHRMTHVPNIFYEAVDHHGDSFAAVLELASTNNSLASYNQYTYAYYALDSYAQEMAAPPNGCVVSAEQVFETAEPVTDLPTATAGAPEVGAAGACHTHAGGITHGCDEEEDHSDHDHEDEASATPAASAAEACHTHRDGVVHCD